VASAYPAGGDGGALLARVGKILEDDRTKGVPADLVAAAKRQEVAAAESQKNSISGLAMEWSNALAVDGRESPDDDTGAIRQVTVADVNRVASRTWIRIRDLGDSDAAASGAAGISLVVRWR
jgi:zinc protease